MTRTSTQTPLRRYYAPYQRRSVSFYNPFSGGLYSEESKLHNLGLHSSLQNAIEACDTSTLFVLPDKEGMYPNSQVVHSLEHMKILKHYPRHASTVVEYQGKKISVRPISLWFSVNPGNTLKVVVETFKALEGLLNTHFQPVNVWQGEHADFPICLLSTPSQTGIDLLQRSLPYKQEYHRLPSDIEEEIHEKGLQGRVETFYHGETTLNNLRYYDGRWMYAACLRHVPVGEVLHDTKSDYMPFVPGFYTVIAKVPLDWKHIGILPCREGGYVRFPNTPGKVFTSFSSHQEVQLALKNGWNIQITERLLWPCTDKSPDMLKLWGERLIKLRMEIANNYSGEVKQLLQQAFRSILLHTVGTFNRSSRTTPGYVRSEEDIPLTAIPGSEVQIDSSLWEYETEDTLNTHQEKFILPHISNFIWGGARKRVCEAALTVPYESLVAIRTDGLWVEGEYPFIDTGKVGQFREKPLQNRSGLQWPCTNGQMIELMRKVR